MFIDPEELIEVKVYYKKIGRHFIAYSDEEFSALDEEVDKEVFKELSVSMRQLTWGIYNELQEAAMKPDQLGNRAWNYKFFKENKLLRLIVKWNATQIEGEKVIPVPINQKSISTLSPDIAEAILSTYDKIALVDDDDAKK